jgi:S-adenosylmethionine synthetase
LHARRAAKAVVLTGAAQEATVRLIWFNGERVDRVLTIDADGGRVLETAPWQELFDLSLEASGEEWTGACDLVAVARYGHFADSNLPWEQLRFMAARTA